MGASEDDFSPAPFDGRKFSNLEFQQERSKLALLRWLATRKRRPWPRRVEAPPLHAPLQRIGDDVLRATVIGHSTVLIQHKGLNVLSDPVWSSWIGPAPWIGLPRIQPPAFPLDLLPPIDVVLLSHNHYDHLDRPTLRRLVTRDDPLILTGKGVARTVGRGQIVELDWWEHTELAGDAMATYVPARHFSARGPFDRNRSLWGGFVLEWPAARLYFAGDTARGRHGSLIRRRFGPMDLSLIPIGAYLPRWMMSAAHVDPAEALELSLTVESRVSVGIHYQTFQLADDDFEAPISDLLHALRSRDKSAQRRGSDFRTPQFGEPVDVQIGRRGPT